MTDSEVFDMIADKELMERTVRCTDVAHPRHMQVGRLLSATTATNSDGSGCVCYVGFATDPTHAGSAIPVRKEGLVAEFLNADQIEFQV
jgi:hypothetical protein